MKLVKIYLLLQLHIYIETAVSNMKLHITNTYCNVLIIIQELNVNSVFTVYQNADTCLSF
jgi:hypothetical protein